MIGKSTEEYTKVIKYLPTMIYALMILWAVQIVNVFTGYMLSENLGIIPREFGGLLGIILAPFLHFGFIHLISNSIPLFVLGSLIKFYKSENFLDINLIIIVISGVLTWALARNGVHAGASALIMGYFGFLVGNGYFKKDFKEIIFSFITLIFYGGLIFSILPSIRSYISWEGHLFGLIAGVLTAWLLVNTTLFNEKGDK